MTGEFPAQRASNAENISIWWRHHGIGSVVRGVGVEPALDVWLMPLNPCVLFIRAIDCLLMLWNGNDYLLCSREHLYNLFPPIYAVAKVYKRTKWWYEIIVCIRYWIPNICTTFACIPVAQDIILCKIKYPYAYLSFSSMYINSLFSLQSGQTQIKLSVQ